MQSSPAEFSCGRVSLGSWFKCFWDTFVSESFRWPWHVLCPGGVSPTLRETRVSGVFFWIERICVPLHKAYHEPESKYHFSTLCQSNAGDSQQGGGGGWGKQAWAATLCQSWLPLWLRGRGLSKLVMDFEYSFPHLMWVPTTESLLSSVSFHNLPLPFAVYAS